MYLLSKACLNANDGVKLPSDEMHFLPTNGILVRRMITLNNIYPEIILKHLSIKGFGTIEGVEIHNPPSLSFGGCKKIGDLSVPYQTSLFCACMVCKGESHTVKVEQSLEGSNAFRWSVAFIRRNALFSDEWKK